MIYITLRLVALMYPCVVSCDKTNIHIMILMKTWYMLRIAEYMAYYSCAFSVQNACGLSTSPTLLSCADATVKFRVGKGRQIIA